MTVLVDPELAATDPKGLDDEIAPLYTMQTRAVAFVHVPEVSEVDVQRLYPIDTEQSVPSVVLVIFVHPAGIVGFVVEPSRNAKMTMRSPTRWPEGIVIVVASAEALPIRLIAINPLVQRFDDIGV